MPAKEISSQNYSSSIPSYVCLLFSPPAFLVGVSFITSTHTNKQRSERNYKQDKTYINLSINITRNKPKCIIMG